VDKSLLLRANAHFLLPNSIINQSALKKYLLLD
jgi:hypothetical protein